VVVGVEASVTIEASNSESTSKIHFVPISFFGYDSFSVVESVISSE